MAMMTTRVTPRGRVAQVLVVCKLRFTFTFRQWQDAHDENAIIRTACCDEHKTLIFRSVADPVAGVALLLEDVDYEALKKYLGAINHEKFVQKTEAFLIYRRLPPGLPPGCLAKCLGYLVPIHGHFVGVWTIEQDYDKWFAYYTSEPMVELRAGFGVPIDLYRCVNDSTKVLGLAADVNWKACVRFLGARELYEAIPAARRAGEIDFLVYDGAKIDREKDVVATVP